MSFNKAAVLSEERKRFLYYRPHPKQEIFHAFGADCRERLFLAGNRVGKTFCGATEMAMHLTGRYPAWWAGRRFTEPVDAWAASDTSETTRDILQNEYLGNPSKGTIGAIHPSLIVDQSPRRGIADAVDTVLVRHFSGKVSQLGFKSYDQGRAKFQGTHKDLIHLDEEPPQDVYDECFMRTTAVGNKARGMIMMTMTPLGGATPLIQTYTDKMVSGTPVDGRVFVQAGWEDNIYLAEEERIDLEKRFASRPHELEARKLGKPSIGSGMIFPIQESLITCPPFQLPDTWPRCAGMDFGWTNPTAVVWLAYDKDADVAYVYADYAQSELAPASHVANIHARGDWIPVAGDPAGQAVSQKDGESLIEKYASHKLRIEPANNEVESGLQEVFERMLTGRLKIFTTCEGLLSEIRSYARDEKGRVKKMNDHRCDALRYGVVSGLPIAKAKGASSANWRSGSGSAWTR